MKSAEDCLWQDELAAHRVQQYGGAGPRGEAGGELQQHQAGQEPHAEQLTADLQAAELAADTESSNTSPGWNSWVVAGHASRAPGGGSPTSAERPNRPIVGSAWPPRQSIAEGAAGRTGRALRVHRTRHVCDSQR